MSESGSESHVVSAAKSRLLLQSFVSVLSLNLLLSIYLLLSLINIYFQLFNSKSKRMNNALIFFFFLSSLNFLNRIPNMALVVTLRVSAHREYRASQEARDPRDQLVQRDHPGITDPKDLWVHEESKAMKDPVENRDFLAQMEVRGQLVQQAQAEARVIQVLLEVKVPQAPRGLQGLLHVIGSSAFLRICTIKGTLDWSR